MTNRYDELIRSTLGSMVAEAPEPIEFDQLTMPVTQEALSRRRWPPVATSAVAFAAVLVLVGGAAFLFQVSEPDAPVADTVVTTTVVESAPTTVSALQAQSPGLTEDIPEGVESGTVTTSLGSARWVHLNSNEYLLPSLGWLKIYADDGFVVSDLPSGFWQSDDGITWRWEESFNVKPSVLDHSDMNFQFKAPPDPGVVPWVPYVDGSYSRFWFINTDPLEIETSEGGRGFEVDLTGLVPPKSSGFTWTLDVSIPLTRYTDDGTQSLLHARFSGPDDQVDQRLLVIEHGDDATYLNVPWDVDSVVSLFGTSETLFAYVGDSNSNQISVWRSNDGYRWTESGGLHAQLGVPASSSLKLTVLPALGERANEGAIRNQVVVVTTPGYGWESTDGVNWTPAPEGLPEGTDLIRLESGWFATDGDVWWMHLGDRWVSLADLGMERTGDGCQIVPRGAGQTTIFFSTGTCTPDSSQQSTADLWIISVDS